MSTSSPDHARLRPPDNLCLLLVEDVDRIGVRRALRSAEIDWPLLMARDGQEALEILRGEGGHQPPEGPVIILLDLNLPRMGGLEFLHDLRQDDVLRRNVVFVLTTSDAPEDRQAAYDLQVAGYLVKPRLRGRLSEVMGMLEDYARYVRMP